MHKIFNRNLKILTSTHRRRLTTSSSSPPTTARAIRQRFTDYFVNECRHKICRSSPVVPFCDPTVAFVNAGMVQFKQILLGARDLPAERRVCNTQKCIRVGGKHNDLSVVGSDGYHHTFFEMMGNWSFGDYFKKEACEYAWRLLTESYRIDPNRLYVTYFAGDERLGLGPDLECREIWRSIGLSDDRILPFGARDNFWEMGATGPCGPCTEIHFDHVGRSPSAGDRAAAVNAGHADLTEIWNLVFIQYNRHADNSLKELPYKHVDTGMGFERLVAVLQGKSSNYGTDLFTPIFDQIQQATKVPAYIDSYDPAAEHQQLYTSYRILADHSRMITACLADGMIPEQNHKLRRCLRKALSLSARTFNSPDLLLHTTVPATVAILGDTYPEMRRQLPQIQQILRHEQDVYRQLLAGVAAESAAILASNRQLDELDIIDSAGFVPAFKELRAAKLAVGGIVSGELMFKLYDTYGLRDETIERLADVEGLRLDRGGFERCMQEARARTKSTFASNATTSNDDDDDFVKANKRISATENELKYNYRFNFAKREYYSPRVRVQVVAVRRVGSRTPTAGSGDGILYDIVLDQSIYYPESGGQESDGGRIVKVDNSAGEASIVKHVRLVGGDVVVHRVVVPQEDWLRVGDFVDLEIDAAKRTACTLHHTVTHLLNACVRHVTKSVCYQKSSSVTEHSAKLELIVMGRKIDANVVDDVQTMIRTIIRNGLPITLARMEATDFYAADNTITRIPGEIYPDRDVRIVSIGTESEQPTASVYVSREPCCGTHALNTRELEHFCITHVRHSGRGAYALTALAGRLALAANELGESVRRDLELLQSDRKNSLRQQDVDGILQRLRSLVGAASADSASTAVELPYLVRIECQRLLADVGKSKRDTSKESMKSFVDHHIHAALALHPPDSVRPFCIFALPETDSNEPIPLQRATKILADHPAIVVCRSSVDGSIRARCVIPKQMVTDSFAADQWLREFASEFGAQLAEPQKGQRPDLIAVMKACRVPADKYADILRLAVQKAHNFAEKHLTVSVESRVIGNS